MRKKEDENKIEFYEISNFKFYLEDDMGSPINTVNAYISDLRQYQDLTYEIKDETIDGDNATVTAQIEVYDYYKVNNEVNNYIGNNSNDFATDGVYDTNKGLMYRIGELSKSKDRVIYTITLNLTKVNDDWTIDNLTNEDLEKIHGTYVH